MVRLYVDHAATTPLLPEALEAMAPWLRDVYGNPSSLYREGRAARSAVDESRAVLAKAFGCQFAEVCFTSSGTEAANLAIVGAALAASPAERPRVLLSAAEHHCALACAPILHRLGFAVEQVPVDRFARPRLDWVSEHLDERVLLVSAMHANNELGTVTDVCAIADLCRQKGVLLHVDAVQTFCAVDWTVDSLGADMVSVSAHKAYGPKGVGALYLRAGTRLEPILVGGGQERERRAGTENVAGIVGFAAAVQSGPRAESPDARDTFLNIVGAAGARRTVPEEVPSLPGHAHVKFPCLKAESMLIVLDQLGVSASSGAACSSGSVEPSHVLLACGWDREVAAEGLRFTFGRGQDAAFASEVAARVLEAARRVGSAG